MISVCLFTVWGHVRFTFSFRKRRYLAGQADADKTIMNACL